MMNKVEIIQNWIDKIKESNSLVNPVIDALQCEPENPISNSIDLIQTAYTEAVKQLVGDDQDWLDWFWWDNEMGMRGFEAGLRENKRPIKTAEDLVWVMELMK